MDRQKGNANNVKCNFRVIAKCIFDNDTNAPPFLDGKLWRALTHSRYSNWNILQATHELEPDLILSKVLDHYDDNSNTYKDDYAKKNRDMVLDALSDSGSVAPLIMAANLHSPANPKSYMYVFSHAKAFQQHKSVSDINEDWIHFSLRKRSPR